MPKNPFVGDLIQPNRLKELIEKVSEREINTIADFYKPIKPARRDKTKIAEEAIEDEEYQRVLCNLLRHGDKKTREHIWEQIDYHKEEFNIAKIKKEIKEIRRQTGKNQFLEDKINTLNNYQNKC